MASVRTQSRVGIGGDFYRTLADRFDGYHWHGFGFQSRVGIGGDFYQNGTSVQALMDANGMFQSRVGIGGDFYAKIKADKAWEQSVSVPCRDWWGFLPLGVHH